MKLISALMMATAVVTVADAQITVHDAGRFQGDTTLYCEPYRPGYHFTPAHRWIGDPCGLIKADGHYRGYSWGAASTDDLVHWREINRDAILGRPEGIAPFTGSVVVDRDNTAGEGAGTYTAVFTSFDRDSKIQAQVVAFSDDGGDTFQYYEGNPVIDISSTEFRDPTVIWYPEGQKWIMAVAKALDKKVSFYESPDLKQWTWLSDFGPMGDNEKSWECPDLFQVEVEETGERKWVLLVSVNWAREQYFVGDFDGVQFIPDKPYSEPLYVDEGLDYYASRVFQDFDDAQGDVFTLGWVNTWDYAQQAPSQWGKGLWSLPRKYTLYSTADGLKLRQTPVKALETLRGDVQSFTCKANCGRTPLPEISAMDNCYELDVELIPSDGDVAGLNLCCGEGRKVGIIYDAASGYLIIDRLNSTPEDLPKFSRMASCKVADGNNAPLEMKIFVDNTTIEIFADGGKKVFTLLTYAAPGQAGAECFSLNGNTEFRIKAWPIKNIWR
ncbi:MAG: glycoside hydrolase family 32 protein [Muribaculum sp.]|nr:glycoside hydrolase family 32 protein [Muribaculum sp.]